MTILALVLFGWQLVESPRTETLCQMGTFTVHLPVTWEPPPEGADGYRVYVRRDTNPETMTEVTATEFEMPMTRDVRSCIAVSAIKVTAGGSLRAPGKPVVKG